MTTIENAVGKYFEDCRNGCNNLILCEDLFKAVGRNDKMFIMDIRKKEDYEIGHIENAVNIFWYEVDEFLDVLPKDEKIIVVCYSGQSAGQVVSLLKILGFDACALKGGMLNGWSQTDFPIEAGCGWE